MRIAQVAPLYESVPPQFYGGTERVVSYLRLRVRDARVDLSVIRGRVSAAVEVIDKHGAVEIVVRK